MIAMCAKKQAEQPPEAVSVDEEEGQKNEELAEGEEEEEELTEEERKKRALESYQKAGKIAKEALEKATEKAQVGVKVIDLITEIEAAHYTSGPVDMTEIEEGMVVKLDLGVHVEGYIADTATTVNFNTKDPALENICISSEKSMETAIDMIKVGAKTNDIGKKINEIIKSYKYNPVRDLSGHTLDRWMVHGSKQIPLIAVPTGQVIEQDDVFAVETF